MLCLVLDNVGQAFRCLTTTGPLPSATVRHGVPDLRLSPDGPYRRLRGFVVGSLAIALLGAAINGLVDGYPDLAARLLRFYFFRLSDVAVPHGGRPGRPAS